MIRQVIYLEPWSWYCSVYYDVDASNTDSVLDALRRAGCSRNLMRRAERNLLSDYPDTGLTFSNPDKRESVCVIGRASTPDQFWNTLDHEKGHLTMHIADMNNIDHAGEEYQYLAGTIAQATHKVAKRFICTCS